MPAAPAAWPLAAPTPVPLGAPGIHPPSACSADRPTPPIRLGAAGTTALAASDALPKRRIGTHARQ